jgi:Kdo2-lipid IVA lauroyltransferase/acyltransferase
MRALLHWLSRRPLRHLHALGAGLGWLAYGASKHERRRERHNAALAGVSTQDRRASISHAGRMVAELPRLWLRPADRPIEDPVLWDNAELIDTLLAQGKGLVLLTPHLGSFEVAAQAYAQRFGAQQPITVLYRPARQAWLRELEETARARPHLATAPASLAGVRLMMRALRKGQTIGLLPDQVPPDGMGVWAPFFGKPAYTMTLAAKLVQQTGAAVCLIWVERLPRGGGYRVCLRPMPEPLPARPEGSDAGAEEAWLVASASVINRAMESVIRQLPTQYLWAYNRYKNPRQEDRSQAQGSA